MRGVSAICLLLAPVLVASVAVRVPAQENQPTPPSPARLEIELRVAGSPAFARAGVVPVAEALVVPTLSVFAGKSGVVRLRGGVVAPILVLSSQKLGCGAVQQGPPAVWGMTKKAAAAMEARLATTRPRSTFAPVQFVPSTERDFSFQLTGRQDLEADEIREIERDPTARPATFQSLFGSQPMNGPRQRFVMTEDSVWTPLLGGYTFRSTRSGFELWREAGQLWADIDVHEATLTVRGKVPLEVCPPLAHLHIEAK